MASNKRKARQANFNIVVARNIRADGWLKKYRLKMNIILDKQAREVSRAIGRGASVAAWQKRFTKKWERELRNGKRDMILDMVVDGYILALEDFPDIIEKPKGKDWVDRIQGKATAVDIAVAESQLRDTRLRADVEKYINETSKLETATSAKKYAAYHTAAIEEGLTIRQVARRVLDNGLAVNKSRAILMARTTTIWAYNFGATEMYKDAGVGAMEWIATLDELTAEDDAAADGEQQVIGKNFSTGVVHPPAHPNCLVGETAIIAPDKRAAFVAPYTGVVIEIGLSKGTGLTCTPNHMLLTPDGFVFAKSLNEGDKVLYSTHLNNIAVSPDNYGNPSRIDKIVESFAKSGRVSTVSVPAAAEYLHGDGINIDGDINIIRPDSLLLSYGEVKSSQRNSNSIFLATDAKSQSFAGSSRLALMLEAMGTATFGNVSGKRESLALFGSTAIGDKLVSLTGGAESDAVAIESAGDCNSIQADRISDVIRRFKGEITTADITFKRVRNFTGHVYDLQTKSTLYLAEGVLSSNCRCAVVPVVTASQVVTAEEEIERQREIESR